VDDVIYSLNETTSEAVTVSVEQDVDGIYENIESFVTDYNALLDTINGLLSEDYDLDYPPLTDAQKDEMTDDEITNWETQAKTGLLEDDPILQTMLDKLRSALMSSVSGASVNLAGLGISTSAYDEKGKLHIDEDTLKQAIQNDPEEVMKLFAKQSTSHPGTSAVRGLTSAQRAVRYSEEGIAYRLYDILQDNIGTVRDSSGCKGFLLEKAGMENDASVTANSLTELLEDLSGKIEKEEDRLDDKADSLYAKYTNLETYINQMNAQLAALTSSTSSGS
jgi:flagellar hook-associated protein 2